MKPTTLNPGDHVSNGSHILTFLRRETQPCRSAINVFSCDDYRGLNSPTDPGICTATDTYAARNFTRVEKGQII